MTTIADTTEEFAERMVAAIDSASLAILLSLGHQTKLFDTLAELLRPPVRRSPTPPDSTNAMCGSGWAAW
jgi:hypothetical protein